MSPFSVEENVSKVDVWERVKHVNLHTLTGKLEIIFKPFMNHLNPSLVEVVLLIIPYSIIRWFVIFNWVMRVLKIEAFITHSLLKPSSLESKETCHSNNIRLTESYGFENSVFIMTWLLHINIRKSWDTSNCLSRVYVIEMINMKKTCEQ